MDNQNLSGQENALSIELMAWASADRYINNAEEACTDDFGKPKDGITKSVALHAILQQREKHHIEFVECLKVLINEVCSGGNKVDLGLELLTNAVDGVKSEIQGLQLSIEGVAESIDFASNKPPIHWMESIEAATDLAKEIGLNILPEWSFADLRYKLDMAINGQNEAQGFKPISDIEASLIKAALTKHYLDNLNEQPSEAEHNLAMARIDHIARGR